MPPPARSIDPGKLPGAILLPTYFASCASCEETTPHAGLGGEDGRELGSYCLCCGTRDDWRDRYFERLRFEIEAERRGFMETQPDLLAVASGE